MHKREHAPGKVDLINIGDELLNGLSDNKHLKWVSEMLAGLGLQLHKNLVVRDDDGALAEEFLRSLKTADVIITTGGMGSRHDDFTRETVARILDKKLVYDKKAERCLAERLAETGAGALTTDQLAQCWLPEGATILPNIYGNSPGILLREKNCLIVMLPGNEREMQEIFKTYVRPALKTQSPCGEDGDLFVQIRTFGSDALSTEDKIRPIVNHAGVKIASTENAGIVDIRLTPGNSGLCNKGLLEVAKKIREELGEEFVCTGNRSLAELVAEQLLSLNKTISVAESCTGGLLSGALTEISGISESFIAGAVTYAAEIKELLGVPPDIIAQHGEVSAETAVALASAAAERFGTDYGLSVTGYAGPTGGTRSDPVGTIYVGYSSPQGDWAQRFNFTGNRRAVRAKAVNAALDLLRRKLTKYNLRDTLAGIK